MKYFAAILFGLIIVLGVIVLSKERTDINNASASRQAKTEKATFAGGCFWCMQPPYDKLKGVVSTTVGYTGGHKKNPTYEDVSTGATGHYEAVEIVFDPAETSYNELLDVFWRNIDPTNPSGQFADIGPQYRTAIFYHNEEQKRLAIASKEPMAKSGLISGKLGKPIATEILPASEFYPAEDYHQEYYKKNPARYNLYKFGSGRESFLKGLWGDISKIINPAPVKEQEGKHMKPPKEELKKKLTPLQYNVTQECGTEMAFQNEYWDNHREGIYVDIVSGEPLFSSKDKFDSGTGWPSFMKPLEPENIKEKEDRSRFMKRTEVKSKRGGSHLGHVFDDGPRPTGLRYCINSAALRFIPKEDLEKEGYGQYKKLFEDK